MVRVDDPRGLIVYEERRSWTKPLEDPGWEIAVTGPDGDEVDVKPSPSLMNYRWFRLVRQARATFDAPRPGTYTVTVSGDGPDAGRITAGPNLTTSMTTAFLVPVVVFLTGMVVAAVLAAKAAPAREHRREGPDGERSRRREDERCEGGVDGAAGR